jgi:hypothetical protein
LAQQKVIQNPSNGQQLGTSNIPHSNNNTNSPVINQQANNPLNNSGQGLLEKQSVQVPKLLSPLQLNNGQVQSDSNSEQPNNDNFMAIILQPLEAQQKLLDKPTEGLEKSNNLNESEKKNARINKLTEHRKGYNKQLGYCKSSYKHIVNHQAKNPKCKDLAEKLIEEFDKVWDEIYVNHQMQFNDKIFATKLEGLDDESFEKFLSDFDSCQKKDAEQLDNLKEDHKRRLQVHLQKLNKQSHVQKMQLVSKNQVSNNEDPQSSLKRKRDGSSSSELSSDDNSAHTKKKTALLTVDLTSADSEEIEGNSMLEDVRIAKIIIEADSMVEDVPTTGIILPQSEMSNQPQEQPSELIGRVNKRQPTPVKKSSNNCLSKTGDKESLIKAKDQLGKITSKKRLDNVKVGLAEMEKYFANSDFLNALETSKKILKIEGVDKLLVDNNYLNVFQCFCNSSLKIWENEKDQDVRNNFFKRTFSNIQKYLSKDDSKKFFMLFAASVYEHAVSLIVDRPYSSFKFFKHLLKMDLNYKDLIGDDFNQIVDDILYNMTACISELKDDVKKFNILCDKTEEYLNKPLIPVEKKEFFQKWLDTERAEVAKEIK